MTDVASSLITAEQEKTRKKPGLTWSFRSAAVCYSDI